jgi:hypothetical protein
MREKRMRKQQEMKQQVKNKIEKVASKKQRMRE